MANQPKGSHQLSQHQSQPHSYKKRPDEDREADKVLEELVQELIHKRGLTREEALKHARHWV